MNIFANTRIILSGATLLAAGALITAATFAFLSDTETSTDNEFEAGVLDLQIDNTSYYNGVLSESTTWELGDLDGKLFFNFLDVKPGDWGEDTISIHVNNNDAWACFDTTLTSDDDVSSTEPELLDGDTSDNPDDLFDGELGGALNFVFWVDDGDNVLETDEVGEILAQGPANIVLANLSVTLADTLSNLFEEDGEPLTGGATYYIAKAWCFGALGLNPVEAGQGQNPTVASGITCDGSLLDNATQTDTLTADVNFSAVQSRNNPEFYCAGTPTPTPTPAEIACLLNGTIYADDFSDVNQGTRKNGTAILPDRTNPNSALGAPQSNGDAFDNPVIAGSFFALGFDNGSIVLSFAEPFYNDPDGADLQVYEVTGGTSYPMEVVNVEVSSNGTDWTSVGSVSRDGTVELGAIQSAQYVKLTEASNKALFEDTADGYDLDAVAALCTQANNLSPLDPDAIEG